jgi:hypothetical protein
MKIGMCSASILLALLSPVPLFAGMALTVTPNGDDTILLQGRDVREMASVEISFDWNPTLGEPRVSVQGGSVAGTLTNARGGMTVKVVRDDPDAVLDIEVGFDTPGDMSRAISNVAVSARDADGASYPVPVDFVAPEAPPVWEPSPGQTSAPGGEQASSRGPKQDFPAALRRPTARSPRPERGSSSIGTAFEEKTDSGGEGQGSAPDTAGAENARMSVLQRFRAYRGKRGLREFAALFAREGGGIRQEPAVAIADGKTPVRISLELDPRDGYAPNFAMSDAKFVALHKEGEKSWTMTLVPNKGAWEVGLILRMGKEKIEFPLTVVPPVNIPDGLNETNFLAKLDRYLADQAARGKEEGGPFRRYLHEYIFTANYLITIPSSDLR